MHTDLLEEIDRLFSLDKSELNANSRSTFETFLTAMENGEVRAAEKKDGKWMVNAAVKKGVLLGFRLGRLVEFEASPVSYSDKDTYPAQKLPLIERNIRVVPGGNSVRRGAYIGNNVVMMPPAFVNAGAYVGDGTVVDSHALIGSCAQIGKNVHISAGVQIGGVLEPIGLQPVVVEDNVLIGGNSGVYEGVQVSKEAVIAAGCIVTASTPVYDLVHEKVYRSTPESPLVIPERAVVIPGSRPARGEIGRAHV